MSAPDSLTLTPTLPVAVEVARFFLAEAEQVDIHDHMQVIGSHASVVTSLRQLLAVLSEEGLA